jgi:hypothetical protein
VGAQEEQKNEMEMYWEVRMTCIMGKLEIAKNDLYEGIFL